LNGLSASNRKKIAILRIKLQPFFLIALMLFCGDPYTPPEVPVIEVIL